MADRYFHSDLQDSRHIRLEAEAAHHLCRVLRKQAGDEVRLFDGQGREARCALIQASSRRCDLEVLEIVEYTEPRLRRVELAFSPPKGGRAETLLQMATELGCAAFHPLRCERTPPEGRGQPKRWERVLQAAAGQSGARWLPQLSPAQSLEAFVEQRVATGPGEAWLATPGQEPGPSDRAPLDLPDAIVLVGPEGDFSPREKERILSAGGQVLPLGPQILRVETACTAALTRLLHAPPAWRTTPPVAAPPPEEA